MVVSNIVYLHPYLGKVSILTNIFQEVPIAVPALTPPAGWGAADARSDLTEGVGEGHGGPTTGWKV